jgi:hypothetical protein
MHNGNAPPTVMQLASTMQSKFAPVSLALATYNMDLAYNTASSQCSTLVSFISM